MDLSHITWRKSSRSGNGANCVEVAVVEDVYLLRDSKHPEGPKLVVHATQWRDFIADLKNTEFDQRG
ncbi:DUF397 domain-containing protein [Sphaerisporangium corydalis]|uniref:DUF397 domain-containing protein n=1 Tax=Sphaerisporangium corydalis TaxID=1441875 RepID=A0ABV9EFL2_9ACTN|nr:DUF397 domain-containing protein [Sphaerisporangium corydalis]